MATFLNNQETGMNSNNTSFEKAAAFLNFQLPTVSGGIVEIGAVALRESNKAQAKLLEKIKAGEVTPDQLLKALKLRIVVVDPDKAKDIELDI